LDKKLYWQKFINIPRVYFILSPIGMRKKEIKMEYDPYRGRSYFYSSCEEFVRNSGLRISY